MPAPLVLPTISRACARGRQQNSGSKEAATMLGTVGTGNWQFCYETSWQTFDRQFKVIVPILKEAKAEYATLQ
jgi:hypothetical protein